MAAMNPEGYPCEAATLHGGRHDGLPLQPNPPRMVQYTTVNMTTEPPQDYIIWSLCSLVHFNPLCLGMTAFTYSVKARDRKMIGDLEGARRYGSIACRLNLISTVLIVIAIVIFLFMFEKVQAFIRN
ncbi:dispanin subfamily A member 2b-like [Scomber japonicus]|uniref:dispanin subfamily A member 2b-like n=1 Tax=Scomber japonicus TaxID=13676 RepID=UPI0023054B5B|nr:dispanin subfamily A member 2b-like [Scomber japonicus]